MCCSYSPHTCPLEIAQTDLLSRFGALIGTPPRQLVCKITPRHLQVHELSAQYCIVASVRARIPYPRPHRRDRISYPYILPFFDVVPALIQRWRELVMSIEQLAEIPEATLEDIEAARANLHALLGTVTLKPRNGILWAYPAPNTKGPCRNKTP